MKMLSSETKNLLDKLYNLRGKDSVVLTKMDSERDEAIATQDRTKKQKEELNEKIANLTNDEQTLAQQGEKLTKLLESINRDDYAIVLDRLNINFDPADINKKLTSMLPDTISKVVEENKKASKELEEVEAEMNNAITKIEELGIRKEEALNNQNKLNEYFDLALDGNINITRDAITSLLQNFDFTEDEQREAAKILMFPEDALYQYDANIKSEGTKTKVTAQVEKVEKQVPSNMDEVINSALEKENLHDAFEQAITDNGVTELETKNEEVDIKEFLNNAGIDSTRLLESDLKKLTEKFDSNLFTTNIDSLKNHNIALDIVDNTPELLTDAELNSKIDKLIEIGKSIDDIYLTPKVLVKYNLEELENTINALKNSGLDPKMVPLMAY